MNWFTNYDYFEKKFPSLSEGNKMSCVKLIYCEIGQRKVLRFPNECGCDCNNFSSHENFIWPIYLSSFKGKHEIFNNLIFFDNHIKSAGFFVFDFFFWILWPFKGSKKSSTQYLLHQKGSFLWKRYKNIIYSPITYGKRQLYLVKLFMCLY